MSIKWEEGGKNLRQVGKQLKSEKNKKAPLFKYHLKYNGQ